MTPHARAQMDMSMAERHASFQGQILRAGTPGTVTHFSGTPLVYTGVYGGQTGMFSVRLENTANAIAVNYSGERGYADFYDGGTNYGTQIQRIKSFSCTTLTECQNASWARTTIGTTKYTLEGP